MMRTDDKNLFKHDRSLDEGGMCRADEAPKSPKFPGMKSTSEIIEFAMEKGGLLMAHKIVESYDGGGRFGYKPSDPEDPMHQVNRILDIANSRNRVVEQAGRCRDEIEGLIKLLWPCAALRRTESRPSIIVRLERIAAQLTEVLIDATGD